MARSSVIPPFMDGTALQHRWRVRLDAGRLAALSGRTATVNNGDVTKGFAMLALGRNADAARAFREGEAALGHPSVMRLVAWRAWGARPRRARS